MPKKKSKRTTSALIMRADDVMPWGKHQGETIRTIYRTDQEYFQSILKSTNAYSIPEKTLDILEQNLDIIDRTTPTFSKGARLNKTEYRADDIVWEKDDQSLTLEQLFMKNESYYRSLVVNKSDVFISQKTFEAMMVKKYGPESVSHLSRQELNEKIQNSISGFQFSDDESYGDADITSYIGEQVTTDFSPQIKQIIAADQKEGTFDLRALLKEVFGESAEFREGQEEAILAVLNGRRTLVVQHTGWGKSLVYFLSIKKLRQLGKGPAIIISPLLALMHDQIESTKKYGLNVKAITSDTKKEWKNIYSEIKKDTIDAILISPERLGDEGFIKFIGAYISKIALFVVDEAHCISDWGHDFRPDFRRIVRLIKQLPEGIPVLATTATANDRVVRDLKFQLGKDLEILRGTMDRKSINIDVLNLETSERKIDWLLRNIPQLEGAGIIYCLTIHDCEEVTEILQEHDINAEIYHARLTPEQKKETEERFQRNEIKALVATIAFGMGIDKPDIAFVIHYQQPANVISYYQQIGRAGRAIDSAYAILLAGDEDNSINRYFIANAFPTENEMNAVIKCITDNPGIRRNEIMEELNVSQTWSDKVLKYLLVNGDIYKKNFQYYKTAKEWTCDMKRARIVSWFRWKELRRFNEFIDSTDCYMKFIREELDDINVENCGHCANCLGHHFWP